MRQGNLQYERLSKYTGLSVETLRSLPPDILKKYTDAMKAEELNLRSKQVHSPTKPTGLRSPFLPKTEFKPRKKGFFDR
ncbi:hypothetical protein HSE3_gp048 [Bacillus phage vB_BceM-HSE3]|nr:hypothetical protein HSE3_gp048 [Bacillus phage vB_BceM-HSE3]